MNPPIAIVNCDLYTPDVCIPQGVVLVAGGDLAAVGPSAEVPLPPQAHVLDAEGGRITPGLIDLTRFDEGVRHPAWPANYGVTSYAWMQSLATEADLPRLAHTADRLRRLPRETRLLGLHLLALWPHDGPLAWEDVWESSDGSIRLLTLPSAISPSSDLLRKLRAAGVLSVLVPSAEMQIPDRTLADSLLRPRRPLTAPTTAYVLATPGDGRSLIGQLWHAVGPDRFVFCSSARCALQTRSVRELMAASGASFAAALAAVTRHPADLLGLPQGRLTPGAPADLLCWTRQGDLAWTMVGGRILFPLTR